MYLSRLLLNPRSRQVQRDTADPYQLHRTIMKAFVEKRDDAGVLHRLDIYPDSGTAVLLVQSSCPPDWTALAEGDYLLPPDPFSGLPNPAVKQINLLLRRGQRLRFRLRANPTVKKARRDEKGERRNSNRVPLVHEAQQVEWLQKRAQAHGFCLLHLEIGHAQALRGHKGDDGRLIKLYTVQYDGRLQITDPTQFQEALAKGIGPARAFGCGLLSLAPG
jgi:CRISPR system Cascade subunit CasE